MRIREIKAAARKKVRSGENRPVYYTFLFALCLNLPYLIYNLLDTLLFSGVHTASSGIGGFNLYAAFLSGATLLSLAIGLFASVWQSCYLNFTLNLSRGRAVSFADITAPLRITGKVLWLHFMIAVYTALWSVAFMFPTLMVLSYIAPEQTLNLMTDPAIAPYYTAVFMIPGYLMAYRYRLSFLILFDHEEWSASQAIRESKRLLQGYKLCFFRLDLSFWWYYLLTVGISVLLPLGVGAYAPDGGIGIGMIADNLPLLLEVGILALFLPVVKTADAETYDRILSKAPPMPPPMSSSGDFPVFPGPRNEGADTRFDFDESSRRDAEQNDSWHTYQ